MIGKGWKLAALLLMVFMMGFVVWEIRDFGEPSGEAIDANLDGKQDVEDGKLVWDDETGQVAVIDENGSETFRDRTMMDDYFLEDSPDPNGTVNANNVVTAIVFDYRGFDTLGEATVLFAAVSGVMVAIRVALPKKKKAEGGEKE